MTNAPRKKGTAAESKVVSWWQAQGERQVERHALHGNYDVGDINGIPSLVQSVKYAGPGKPIDLSGWLNELETMKRNARRKDPEWSGPAGLLIVSRPRYGDVGDWYAVQRVADWWDLYRELLT